MQPSGPPRSFITLFLGSDYPKYHGFKCPDYPKYPWVIYLIPNGGKLPGPSEIRESKTETENTGCGSQPLTYQGGFLGGGS